MLNYNNKHVRSPRDLQKHLTDTDTVTDFVSGIESMAYSWGLRAALTMLGQALYGHDDKQTYDTLIPLIYKKETK